LLPLTDTVLLCKPDAAETAQLVEQSLYSHSGYRAERPTEESKMLPA